VHAVVAPKDKQRDRYAPLPGDSQALSQWRERMGTDAAKLIYKERAASIECTNAHLRNRGLQRFNVRSNCIAPFAWSRMTSSIPAETPEQKARVEKIMKMGPEKNAPLAVFLASDAAKEVSGQIFAPRMHELFLFNQSRPIRSIHSAEGWTPESIAEIALPALKPSFTPLDRSGDVFSWDPV